ncbi:MAG TPA: hypothetical protein DEG17_25460, partial [Cyanobacteria bacterium UBA11149]|nr:hypothetical protein [Cyanobacteria bacterium UBA11149]
LILPCSPAPLLPCPPALNFSTENETALPSIPTPYVKKRNLIFFNRRLKWGVNCGNFPINL